MPAIIKRDGLPMDSKNNVRKFREGKMLSKVALARLAGISPLTVDRIERGMLAGSVLGEKSSWRWD